MRHKLLDPEPCANKLLDSMPCELVSGHRGAHFYLLYKDGEWFLVRWSRADS
jgi:hypothetical protein